jgi:hypothetical protein
MTGVLKGFAGYGVHDHEAQLMLAGPTDLRAFAATFRACSPPPNDYGSGRQSHDPLVDAPSRPTASWPRWSEPVSKLVDAPDVVGPAISFRCVPATMIAG